MSPSRIVVLIDTSSTPATQTPPHSYGASQSPAQQTMPSPSMGSQNKQAQNKQNENKHGATQKNAQQIATRPVPRTLSKSVTKFDAARFEELVKIYIESVAQPDPHVFAIALLAGSGSGCRVAQALLNAVPEISSITALDDSRLLIVPAPETSPQSSGMLAVFDTEAVLLVMGMADRLGDLAPTLSGIFSRIAKAQAVACRISSCCTFIGAPVSSKSDP